MSRLTELKCKPCRSEEQCVTDGEMLEMLSEIPDWQIIECDGERRLSRVYKFPDFAEAVRFTDKVAALAEEADHHPSLLTEWGRVTVTWWTHKIKGLHRNDFIMAAKTDAAFEQHAEIDI